MFMRDIRIGITTMNQQYTSEDKINHYRYDLANQAQA